MDESGHDRRHAGRVGLRLPRHLRRQPALSPPEDEPAVVVDRVDTDRGELVLRRRGEDFEVISNGTFLMDTRDGRSERLLVRAGLDAVPSARSLLIGGLGVGFSLLEAAAEPTLERIDVVEIEPTLVQWHDRHLRHLTGDALRDPRVHVVVDDLAHHLSAASAAYDVLCLDVDNGPSWTVRPANDALYDEAGTRRLLSAVRPGGVLTVWSAMPVPDYEALLRRLAATVVVHLVDVQRGNPDVVYVARR
jgi:spermidine synthase